MYKPSKLHRTLLSGNPVIEGEPIEVKVKRLTEDKEPIKDGAPIIYTERKDGVLSAYNIRTDRWEVATDVMDKIHRQKIAQRDNLNLPKEEGGTGEKTDEKGKVINLNKEDSGAKSTEGKAQ